MCPVMNVNQYYDLILLAKNYRQNPPPKRVFSVFCGMQVKVFASGRGQLTTTSRYSIDRSFWPLEVPQVSDSSLDNRLSHVIRGRKPPPEDMRTDAKPAMSAGFSFLGFEGVPSGGVGGRVDLGDVAFQRSLGGATSQAAPACLSAHV